MPSSNITLISDSTILSSLAAEFEAMRARKMPIKCISRAKLCDGVVDCTGKVAIFVYSYLYFLPAWLLYTIPTHPVASWVKTTLNLRPTLLVLIFSPKVYFSKCRTSTHAMCPNFPHKVHTLGIFISIIITCCVQNFVYVCPLFPGDNGSDEEGCSGKETCPYGTFQCLKTKECLPEQRFCNAIADCPDQSDEEEQECRMEFQPSEYCPYR